MNAKSQNTVIAIVGSYRKGGAVDSAVDEILRELRLHGADTQKIYLIDRHIEFCSNCKTCMQTPGEARGRCIIDDDVNDILDAIERADSLVLGAPVNMNNVNAVTRAFMERCAGYGYWPWGEPMPEYRTKRPNKKSILVSASGAPAWLSRCLSGALPALKSLSKLLNAKPIGVLWLGKVNLERFVLSGKTKLEAQRLARKLIGL
ncbi:MAG: flavodoxin family protein [Gammaproteobacteria bacterium]